jgi:hypothetical protein
MDAARERREATQRLELEAFALAHRLALSVHEITAPLATPQPDLASRLRAAATEPAALLAATTAGEPRERRTTIAAARRLANVASYHLLLARDLGHLSAIQYSRLRTDYLRVIQLLTRLLHSA